MGMGVLSLMTPVRAQVLLSEDFSSTDGFAGHQQFFSDGGGDYLGLSSGDFGEGDAPSLKSYSGFNGSFLTGQDLDGEGLDLPVELTWNAIDISNTSQLRFRGKFAEFFDSPGDVDAADFIAISYRVDGGAYQDVLRFAGVDFSSGSSNGVFAVDSDFDGVGDGTRLTGSAKTFESLFLVDGDALDLRLALSLNSGDEDFAVDDFELTAVPEPRETALVAGLATMALVGWRRARGRHDSMDARNGKGVFGVA